METIGETKLDTHSRQERKRLRIDHQSGLSQRHMQKIKELVLLHHQLRQGPGQDRISEDKNRRRSGTLRKIVREKIRTTQNSQPGSDRISRRHSIGRFEEGFSGSDVPFG